MKSVVARIERIRSGHSDRALIHAIDAEGCEYKLEVPIGEVRELPPGHLLVISWSIHANPSLPAMPAMTAPAPPATPSATPAAQAIPTSSSVDAQFMALMSRGNGPRAELDRSSNNAGGNLLDARVAETPSPPGTTPDQQLATMLGMPRDHKPTT